MNFYFIGQKVLKKRSLKSLKRIHCIANVIAQVLVEDVWTVECAFEAINNDL